MLLLYASYDGAINKLNKHTLSELKTACFAHMAQVGRPFFSHGPAFALANWLMVLSGREIRFKGRRLSAW
jgi:hypothetical protein